MLEVGVGWWVGRYAKLSKDHCELLSVLVDGEAAVPRALHVAQVAGSAGSSSLVIILQDSCECLGITHGLAG